LSFTDRGFLEASISTDPENLKSVAVAERLWFHPVETIRGGIDYGTDRGDLRRYKLTSSEWNAPKKAVLWYWALRRCRASVTWWGTEPKEWIEEEDLPPSPEAGTSPPT
jgi:hypothetical protein